MQQHGWGRYPRIDAQVFRATTEDTALRLVEQARRRGQPLTPRGLGRSYGDSSLGPLMLDYTAQDRFLSLDTDLGVLECEAGASLDDILELIVSKGWFLPVTPGTRHVTVGGAIASDVHGKNHHCDGSFSRHLDSFRILTGNGEILNCSRNEHPELFAASCGGMGLTGLILSARLRLRRIVTTDILCRTLRAVNLDHALDLFDEHAASPYSVAWIDCLSRGRALGRSLLMLGQHAKDGPLAADTERPITVPGIFPGAALNASTIRAFNFLYYHRAPATAREQRRGYRSYFYPLDSLKHWNRLYGSAGFLQYQFVIPHAAGRDPLRAIVDTIAASGRGSFLAVLKSFGPGNDHPLSFPGPGYTLALDFRHAPALFPLLDHLDAMVHDAGGRIYLAKDARLGMTNFRHGYPNWEKFETIRARYGAHGVFASAQSRRLGLL